MNKTLIFFLALLLVFSGLMVCVFAGGWFLTRGPAVQNKPVAVQRTPLPDGWLSDFTLVERSGDEFDSKQWRGKVWVASFFFSSCPHKCRQQNQAMQTLHSTYADRGVAFVSITCDPVTDTPERLKEYAADFTSDPEQWVFLTGSLKDIRRVGAEKFFVSISEKTHSERFIVVDKWGDVRATFHWEDPTEGVKLRMLLDKLLLETEPPIKNAEPGQYLMPPTPEGKTGKAN